MDKKPPAPSDTADKFMLRLPDGMRERLKIEAAQNKRSLNAEIVGRLERSLAEGTSKAVPVSADIANVIVSRLAEMSDAELSKTIGRSLAARNPNAVEVPLQSRVMAALDEVIADDAEADGIAFTRHGLIGTIVEDWLTTHKYLPKDPT